MLVSVCRLLAVGIVVGGCDEARGDVHQQVSVVSRASGAQPIGQEAELAQLSKLEANPCVERQHWRHVQHRYDRQHLARVAAARRNGERS